MQSVTRQSFVLWGVVALGLGCAYVVGTSIGQASDVPFDILSNLLTATLAIIAFVSPRSGLYIVVFQAMFTDEFKRIAVTQSTASMELVITVLIGPLITICAIHASIFMKSVVFRTLKTDASYWFFQLVIASLTLGMIVFGEGDMSARGQFAANLGLYLSLLPIIPLLFPTMTEWRKYIALQVLLVLPSAIWGIKQYFYGFTQMEWSYALSGISKAHYASMITGGEHPRVFGFLGSASAFGCMGLYATYALWQIFLAKKYKVFYFISSVVLMVAVVCSTQRTMMLLPFIIMISYYLMLNKRRTIIFYVLILSLLVLGIFSSKYLLDEGLDKINSMIETDSEWGSTVLKVNTFSDRLKGWEQLSDPATWSLFGTGASSLEEYEEKGGHDLVNKMLIKVGIAGLLPVLIFITVVLTLLHRIVWSAPNQILRKEGAFLLACFVPTLVMSIMGGGNLNTVPINLQIWSMLAGVLIFRKQYGINPWKSAEIQSSKNVGA